MKKLIQIIAAVIASLLITTNAVAAKTSDTSDFTVNGIILKTNKNLDSKCKLELYYENEVVDTRTVSLNKPFEFKLKKNVWYTIRVTKEGFVPLLISINTELKMDDEVIDNLFEFETALIDVEQAKGMNQDMIDFPVGLVAFNKETQKFEARDIYTNNFIAALYNETLVPADVAMVYSATKQAPLVADIAKETITKDKYKTNAC